MNVKTLAFGVALAVGIAGATNSRQSVPTFSLVLTAIEDSGSYYIYRYTAKNEGSAPHAISHIYLGVEASSGTPSLLPATGGGYFDNIPAMGPPLATDVTPYAQVGPIIPTGWNAVLTADAELGWQADAGAFVDYDSVAPGDSLVGFAVRSTYLPGISPVRAIPTFQSCCTAPESFDPTASVPEDFQVVGHTTGPRYSPLTADLSVLQGQLAALCSDPLWIDDPALCSEMSDSLDVAAARLAVNNFEGSAVATKGVGYLSDSNRTMWGGDVEDNAHWLLKINSDFVADTLVAGTPPIASVDLCAKGPENTSVTFILSASGGELMETSPLFVETSQEGDPSGTGCNSIWRISWADTAIVDLAIKADSITPGYEVDQVWIQGGLDGDTTLVAQDSVLTRHDGITGAFILFELAPSP